MSAWICTAHRDVHETFSTETETLQVAETFGEKQ